MKRETWTIDLVVTGDEEPLVFRLRDETGGNIRTDLPYRAGARRLSNYAFDHGAAEVRHDYDLRFAEE